MINHDRERLSIEQIRIYESFEKNCGCSLCRLMDNFEVKVLNAISQDLVMDLEFFPKFGQEYTFCDYHMEKFDEISDKLGMAIMIKKLITIEITKMKNLKLIANKIIFFKKKTLKKKCYVCEKMNLKVMKKDVKITVDLWKDKEAFKELYRNQSYFCFNHFKLILEVSKENLNKIEYEMLKNETLNIQMKYSQILEKDIEWFIKKFDYRYSNESWNNSKDAISRAKKILKRDNS